MLEAETILQNRYQLNKKLGDNTARQTWLAIDSQFPENPQVVIKLLAFGGQIQWENLKLFEREAQVLKQLNHPHIPKYRDYFCIDDRLLWFALVEDYIPGASLKELLHQNQRFTEKQVTKIAVDILNILLYLHQLNPPVLHRDIKPSNLIMGEDEQVYLVDFGAVQDSAAKEGGTFTVVGTYGYTPIEQFGGRAVRASDLYALGATLIHLLTGIAPADLPQKDFRIHFSDKVNISPGFVLWLEQLAEPSLEKRFTDVRKTLDALKKSNDDHQKKASLINRNESKIICPYNNRLELNKSPKELSVVIKPLENINLITIKEAVALLLSPYVAIILICALAIVAGSALFKVLLVMLIIFISYLFVINNRMIRLSESILIFQNNILTIEKKLFKIYLYSEKIASLNMQGVYCQLEVDNKLTLTLIDYRGRYVRCFFGQTLREPELIWLAQEIRDWLELQKQREAKH